ncbi:hypothetical protein [Rhodanobacter ginsengiterrae]|uniref:hypothetical protein n=1 Tax=Rhodanobacter ginsengiterrae TaxID=2008451 RepID=UPI003CEBDE44
MSNANRIPGFMGAAVVVKDRSPRRWLLPFAVQLVSIEVLVAQLVYYQGMRETARHSCDGAQDICDVLHPRFPDVHGSRAAAKPFTA